MKLVFISFCCLLNINTSAQGFGKVRSVDTLKAKLPHLKGDDKLDLLTKIAFFYYASFDVQSDSAYLYGKQAMEYAVQATDKRKYFWTADLYAKILLQRSNATEGLICYRNALTVAQLLKNDTMKAIAYRGVGQALWYQGNFRKAIDTIKLSIIYSQRIKNIKEVSDAKMVVSTIYGDMGNYEEAFEASLDALKLSQNINDEDNTILALTQLGRLYKSIGDYETALDYYNKGFAYNPNKVSWSFRNLSNGMGDLYCELQKYDSAYIFYKNGLVGHVESKTSRLRLAEYYFLRQKYDSSLIYFTGLYDELKNTGEFNILTYTMLGMGKIFYAKNDLSLAMYYGQKALHLSEQKSTRQSMRDAYKLLASTYEQLKKTDSAFYFYKQYVQLKDSIITDEFKGKLFSFRQKSEDKEKLDQIESLKQQKIMGRRFTKILVGVIILLGLMILILVRNIRLRKRNQKLQSERIESEWQRKAGELEMQALRAQMNPHFIFNCLSSINKFILKNEPDNASDYLTRFSRLIRLVLVNSQKPLIVLEDEVEMLRLYIEMEKLRFKNSFDYNISYSNEIEPTNILIPPLLLQPFCENAIWHGLMHKEGFGRLDIRFEMQDGMVVCIITDNGIGRSKASEIKTKSAERIKSLGLKLTSERLALFNEDSSVQTFYKMDDIMEDGNVAGTEVKINIKYKEDIEESEKLNND